MSSTVVDINNLTQEEQDKYKTDRMKMFKITIVVCVAYAVIALLMILIGAFTSIGNDYIFSKLLPFSITYIIGTIVIVIYLSNMIYNFQPSKMTSQLSYETELCPDYWKLVPEDMDKLKDIQNKDYLPNDVNINLFKYKCVVDDNLINSKRIKDNAPANYFKISNQGNVYAELIDDRKYDKTTLNKEGNEAQYNDFKKIASTINGYSYNDNGLTNLNNNSLKKEDNTFYKDNDPVPVVCDKLYPLYLTAMDNENLKKNPTDDNNKFRCAYSKVCKTTWTDAGCY